MRTSGNRYDLRLLPESGLFLLAGGLAALLSWPVRFPLSLYMPFSVAVATATAIGMVVGFAMYKHFVFPGSKRAIASQIRDFVIVNIASMALVTGVAAFFVRAVLHQMGIFIHAEGLVHAIGIGAGAVSNFFGHTTISFRVPSAGMDQRC